MGHIVSILMMLALSTFMIRGAHAQNSPKYRASCPGTPTYAAHHGPWTETPSTAFFNAAVKSMITSRRCWVDQKRHLPVLGIRMPSKRIYLGKKHVKDYEKAHPK